jgi:hypothetical protein
MKAKIFSVILALALVFSGDLMAKDDGLASLYKLVDKFLALREKLPTASDSMWSWAPFVADDKSQIQDDINVYLDKSLAVLLDDAAIKTKKEINRLDQENLALLEKIGQLELEKTAAPATAGKLEFWKTSVDKLDDKIAEAKRKIEANNAAIAKKRAQIKNSLAQANVHLTDDQIKTLLITVSGQDQLDALVALKNLYALTDALKNVMKGSTNLSVNKKYYGVFLLATQAHQRQLALFLKRLNDQYLPKLAALKKENLVLMAETRALAAQNPIYANNVEAQKVTDVVADKYRDLLVSQRGNVEDRLTALNEVLKYVENTYRTVSLASSLATSMEDGLNTLQAILEMPILPPVAFENDLESTFLELSAKISSS